MPKIVRHAIYELGGEQKGVSVRLKKWSTSKLFVLVKDFGSMIEQALEGADSFNEVTFISRLITALSSSETRAVRIIRESVEDPQNLSDEAVLSWDPEDFMGILSAIFEMNFTEELSKNFQSLLGTFLAKKKTEEEKKKSSKNE